MTDVAGSGAQANTDGVGAAAEFDELRDLAYYDGKLYILDGTAAVLREMDVATLDVSTIAGQAYTPGVTDGVGTAA